MAVNQRSTTDKERTKRKLIAQQLINDRPRRKKQTRYMSIHVGSRWYRAPEVSLVEKHYDQASDLWSFGCICHELLQYVQKNSETFYEDFQQKRYIFQGGSCFPLSPCKKNQGDKRTVGATD